MMNDLTEYEDFLPSVRKSLYGKTHLEAKPNEMSPGKLKKVKFDHELISSNQNGSNSEAQNSKSEKLKSRKSTPFKKRLKKEPTVRNGNEPHKRKQELVKKATPKKKQVVVYYSSTSSDSFDEELKESQLTPSKSELETFQNTIRSSKRKSCDMSDSTSEDGENESTDDFDLEAFFNTREFSELNESVIEAHSGIDHEFVSDCSKDVEIIESESICMQEEAFESESDNVEENYEDLNESNVSELDSDHKIDYIADKIQDSIVISDDSSKETSSESQETELSGNYSTAHYHDFEDKKIVVLNEFQSISFHGLFTLKVLYGKIEVLGSFLTSNSSPVNLYSPRGSALLYIKNVTETRSNQVSGEHVNINHLLPIQNNSQAVDDLLIEPTCAAVLCSKLEDTKLIFLEKYVSQKIFPRLENNDAPQVVFEPTGNLNTVKTSSIWDEILSEVTCDTKLMITGGKGVGKSTLLRFAINRLLNTFDKVRVLDLDPGQSEFTVPGCISIITLTEPIFGPNFTHLKQPNRSLLSNINVAHDPKAYIKCIESIVSYLETLEGDYPLIINYMGFVQGIGLNLVASAIKYIQPNGIIQICSKNRTRNFKDDLTYQVVRENCKLFAADTDYIELNYKLYKVPAMNDDNDGWTLEPRQSREINILSYFGQMMQSGVISVTSYKLPMYEIKLSAIKITNLQGKAIAHVIANANMVALCSLERDTNVFICRGYGIIRGIDADCNKLVLVTPEQASVLEDVYYLVLGSVFLPPSVYMTPDDVTGSIPYVMEGELVSLGQITKRSYLPANRK